MIVQSSLAADTAINLQKSRTASTSTGTPSNSSQANAADPSLNRMRELSMAESDGAFGSDDTTAADGWMSFLQSNLSAQGETALAAQANLNPATAYSLLQSSPVSL
jgi:hypothetical protein